MNLLSILRHRSVEFIAVGGLLVVLLTLFWNLPPDRLLLPSGRGPEGLWEDESSEGGSLLSFLNGRVFIRSTSYPITITDDAIIFPDGQQQSYRVGLSLRSLQSQMLITTPGPIPMGSYRYPTKVFTTTNVCLAP